jgi:hypothetical protein
MGLKDLAKLFCKDLDSQLVTKFTKFEETGKVSDFVILPMDG